MAVIFYTIAPNDGSNMEIGFKVAKKTEATNLAPYLFKEVNLVYTGWASNSYNLFTVCNDKQKLDDFVKKAKMEFDEIILRNYEVDSINEIEFDDEEFQEELKELEEHLKTGARIVKTSDNITTLVY